MSCTAPGHTIDRDANSRRCHLNPASSRVLLNRAEFSEIVLRVSPCSFAGSLHPNMLARQVGLAQRNPTWSGAIGRAWMSGYAFGQTGLQGGLTERQCRPAGSGRAREVIRGRRTSAEPAPAGAERRAARVLLRERLSAGGVDRSPTSGSSGCGRSPTNGSTGAGRSPRRMRSSTWSRATRAEAPRLRRLSRAPSPSTSATGPSRPNPSSGTSSPIWSVPTSSSTTPSSTSSGRRAARRCAGTRTSSSGRTPTTVR